MRWYEMIKDLKDVCMRCRNIGLKTEDLERSIVDLELSLIQMGLLQC